MSYIQVYTDPLRCDQCEHQLDNVPLTLVVETPWVHLATQWTPYNADFLAYLYIKCFCFEIIFKIWFPDILFQGTQAALAPLPRV